MQAPDKHDETSSSRGRPRDPSVERRVLDAAIAVYGAFGWHGFTFERIAQQAQVGKGALYRRWSGRAALLEAALDTRWRDLWKVDSGALDADLRVIARNLLDLLIDTDASIVVQLQRDSRRVPEVRALMLPFRERMVLHLRAVLARGIAREEIAPDTDIRLVIDIMIGAVTNHVLSTPSDLAAKMRERADTFVSALVSTLMTGISTERK